MYSFRCVFSVNGVRFEQFIEASSRSEAKKIIEEAFPDERVVWWSCSEVNSPTDYNPLTNQ